MSVFFKGYVGLEIQLTVPPVNPRNVDLAILEDGLGCPCAMDTGRELGVMTKHWTFSGRRDPRSSVVGFG